MVNYPPKTREFCIGLHKGLSPKSQPCVNLTPFQIFSGVDSCQHLITRWCCVENQLNWKNIKTTKKYKSWWVHPTGNLSISKILRSIWRCKAHGLLNPSERMPSTYSLLLLSVFIQCQFICIILSEKALLFFKNNKHSSWRCQWSEGNMWVHICVRSSGLKSITWHGARNLPY
jgi:hypothetical protein